MKRAKLVERRQEEFEAYLWIVAAAHVREDGDEWIVRIETAEFPT